MKVTFENATLRDVVSKAGRVAPTKAGASFDKAAGIMLEVDADANEVIVRANNTEVYYMEIIDFVSIEGEGRVRWLLPSVVFDGVCAKLPIASGKQVTLDDVVSTELLVTTGKMKAKVRTMSPEYYTMWPPFDESQLSTVSDFAGRIKQVEWAASNDPSQVPLNGVHLDGEYAMTTDKIRACMTPCKIEHLEEPVTIPTSIFTPLMKNLGDVKIGMDGGMLLVMPDPETQIKAVTYAGRFLNVPKVLKRNETHSILFKKDHMLELVQRAMVMGVQDRAPLLKLYIGEEEVVAFMADAEIGGLMDTLDVPGQATHDRIIIGVTPTNLTSSLTAAPNAEVALYYNYDRTKNSPLRLDGGSGWEALIVPRNIEKAESNAG